MWNVDCKNAPLREGQINLQICGIYLKKQQQLKYASYLHSGCFGEAWKQREKTQIGRFAYPFTVPLMAKSH